MRTLENRDPKLPDPAVLSITIFKRPEDPEPEADSEAEAVPEPSDEKRSAQLKLEAESVEHRITHRPKNPILQGVSKGQDASATRQKARGVLYNHGEEVRGSCDD